MRSTAFIVATAVVVGLWSSACPAQPRGGRRPKEVIEDVGAETASHKELEPLKVKFGSITAMCFHTDGRLLVCDGQAKDIKVISAKGKQVDTIKPGFGPDAIDVAEDGTIYCGGDGKLAKLSKKGKVLKKVDMPTSVESQVSEVSRRRGRNRPPHISGIAVSDKDVFVAFGSGWSMGSKSKLFRFDRNLENPKILAEGLRGCCQRCDIVLRDGVLYVAENAAHRIVRYDRDGKVLGKWGARSRTGLDGFGSCCNPMNLGFDKKGVLYTAESGLGRVKRYSTDGKFLGLVGYVGVDRFTRASHFAASCSNIAIAVSPDAKRVYVMDFKNQLIRVLERKKG